MTIIIIIYLFIFYFIFIIIIIYLFIYFIMENSILVCYTLVCGGFTLCNTYVALNVSGSKHFVDIK